MNCIFLQKYATELHYGCVSQSNSHNKDIDLEQTEIFGSNHFLVVIVRILYLGNPAIVKV